MTECTIKIIKEGFQSEYIYRRHDGYPAGVGEDLQNYFNPYYDKIFNAQTPEELSIAIRCNNYWYEPDFKLCNTAKYLYIIDMNKRRCDCYKVERKESEDSVLKKESIFNFNYDITMEDFVFNNIKEYIIDVIEDYNLQDNKELLSNLKNRLSEIL